MTERQRALCVLWDAFEEEDPDCSTERLIAMVCQAADAYPEEVCEALEAQQKEGK